MHFKKNKPLCHGNSKTARCRGYMIHCIFVQKNKQTTDPKHSSLKMTPSKLVGNGSS